MASKRDFVPQTVVVNSEGARGVVVPDMAGMLNCNGPDEVGVVYEGSSFSSGTDYRELKIVGPESAVADLIECGAGKGSKCCKFLVVGAKGPECQRFGSLRWSLIFKKMVSEREPTEPYPQCKLKG